MRQEGQQARRLHGAGSGSRSISGLFGVIFGLLVTGPALGIASAALWLEPSWSGVITLGLLAPLMALVFVSFRATMATEYGTDGGPSRGP